MAVGHEYPGLVAHTVPAAPAELQEPLAIDAPAGLQPAVQEPLAETAKAADSGNAICGRYVIIEESGKDSCTSISGCDLLSKALDLETGQMVAIKRVHPDEGKKAHSNGVPNQVVREVSVLRGLSHPNVVELKGILDLGHFDFHLVYEHVESDLHVLLRSLRKDNQKLMAMDQVRSFSLDLFKGVHACHCRNLLHRDLKPQNLQITSGGVLKIADFGLARAVSPPLGAYTREVVTLWYRSPELLLGAEKYGFEIDTWSAGCIVAEMAIGHALFPGDSEIATLFKIFELLGTPTEQACSGLAFMADNFPSWPATGLQKLAAARPELEDVKGMEFLRKLLCYGPDVRMTARRAKEHSFCSQAPVAEHPLGASA
jgi:cyclin-dependent kinase